MIRVEAKRRVSQRRRQNNIIAGGLGIAAWVALEFATPIGQNLSIALGVVVAAVASLLQDRLGPKPPLATPAASVQSQEEVPTLLTHPSRVEQDPEEPTITSLDAESLVRWFGATVHD